MLVEKFGIKKYDIDNWTRRPEVRTMLKREKWKFSEKQSRKDAEEALKAAWKYYVLEEKGWSLKDEGIVKKLLRLKTPPSPFSFLTTSKYLSKLKGYDKWINQGLTRVAFAVYKIYPGEKFCAQRNIIPELFFQSHTKNATNQDVVRMVEHIYLYFFRKLKADSPEDISEAKEVFLTRHKENNFFNQRFLQGYGISANHFAKYNYKSVIEQLAYKFRKELGLLDEEETHSWDKDKYIRQNPERNFSKCDYCGVISIDLHHLLTRKERPDLVNNPDNVVPLCKNVHDFITRNQLSDEMKALYETAEADWIKAPTGEKIAVFDEVMHKIHEAVYGNMYERNGLKGL